MLFSIRKGSRAVLEGVRREHEEHKGAERKYWGAVSEQGGHSKRGEVLAPWRAQFGCKLQKYSAIAAPVIYLGVLPGLACCRQ